MDLVVRVRVGVILKKETSPGNGQSYSIGKLVKDVGMNMGGNKHKKKSNRKRMKTQKKRSKKQIRKTKGKKNANQHTKNKIVKNGKKK